MVDSVCVSSAWLTANAPKIYLFSRTYCLVAADWQLVQMYACS